MNFCIVNIFIMCFIKQLSRYGAIILYLWDHVKMKSFITCDGYIRNALRFRALDIVL